jgi:hypothetical protein
MAEEEEEEGDTDGLSLPCVCVPSQSDIIKYREAELTCPSYPLFSIDEGI